MARTPAVNRPSPKAEAQAALQLARKMLADGGTPTPFMLEMLASALDHVAVQLGLVQEVSRPRKAKGIDGIDGRPGAVNRVAVAP